MLTYFIKRLNLYQFRALFKNGQYTFLTRCISTETPIKSNQSPGDINFSADEQQYILQKLNEADEIQLKRYNFPKNRIKNLNTWRKKYGKINSISELLDIDGLGKKSVDKLCKNILQKDENIEVKERPKSRGIFLTPTMNHEQLNKLESSVGIHLYTTGLSWARIERQNNYLSDWNFYEFNLGNKKPSPTDILQLVLDVSAEIPPSDVYIFESPVPVTPIAQQSPIAVSVYVQRIQLLSMLMTLLNTNTKHNPNYKPKTPNEKDLTRVAQHEPNVFFLRQKLSARLFKTLIGTENVSAATTVSYILNNHVSDKLAYTPITVNENLDLMYNKKAPIVKEVLGQALLLTLAFMDLCIYQNVDSLKILTSNSR